MSTRTSPRVVVVGSGIAGLVAAIEAARSGCHVTLATKSTLDEANTRYAQGGIAGAVFDDDSPAAHERDTVTAGAGLADPDAVRVLVHEGPDRIRDLVRMGVAFDRDESGEWVKGLEAAHSYPRVLHAGGDATGAVIEEALVARIAGTTVEILEHAFLTEVTVEDGRATGADFLVGEDAPRARHVAADAVVLATGGAGQLYSHTTNPAVATGDGIAAALRAGAEVADLEFVQFHPTVLAVGDAFLVSEAVRGEGAVLIDENGTRFALDAHPDGELAPRDVVARAIGHTMAHQGQRPVLLDATRLDADDPGFLARRFPTIDAAVRARGLDWTRDPIPVTPAAHYLMGGVRTDHWGRTTVPGLYAVGEVARTGVHGANRLASNSLLEGAVFGARAGATILRDIAAPTPPRLKPSQSIPPSETAPAASEREKSAHTAAPRTASTAPSFDREALQDLMWHHAGLVRDEDGLRAASETLAAWRSSSRPARTRREHEDDNLLTVATAVVAAARARTASVGAHFRLDAADVPEAPHAELPFATAASC